ncbi:M28 family peptidase [Dyella sp.]|uniref:M28 family peptidase n=1 Tax=Dyella sp. TaxID=1869338 RepID=UPI002ED5ADF7
MRRLMVVLLAAFCLGACHHGEPGQTAGPAAAATAFSPGIVARDLAVHVRALADIRSSGQDESHVIDYVTAQFKRIGLEPGNNGQWLQEVPYLETSLRDPASIHLSIEGGRGTALDFAYGDQMLAGSPGNQAHAALDHSPLVFVGYGVDAPDQHWNDYDGIDVRGKTVIVLSNDPGWSGQDPSLFRGRNFTHYGLWVYKLEEAARQGAAAAFIVHDDAFMGSPWSSVQNAWKRPQLSLAPEAGEPRLPVAGWLSKAAAEQLFASAGMDFQQWRQRAEQRGFKAITMPLKGSMSIDSTVTARHTFNIVGKVTGSRQPQEVVLYSAHWDRVSHDANPLRRAVDSGSGMAGLLEIAEAFAHSAPKPHRSLLFVATALGDAGMLGSRYYVEHPLMPLSQTVAAINLDTLPIAGPDRTIALIGYGQSQLDEYLEAAARVHHRTVLPDQAPERGFFFRSDQINFANAGIPVLYASSSTTARAPREGGDGFDMRGAIEDLRMLYMVGDKLSMETSFPQWKPDSDFRRPQGVEAR